MTATRVATHRWIRALQHERGEHFPTLVGVVGWHFVNIFGLKGLNTYSPGLRSEAKLPWDQASPKSLP
jgi:hypothetical protein